MLVHVHRRTVSVDVLCDHRGFRLPRTAIVLATVESEWRGWLPFFDEDQDVSRVRINNRASTVVTGPGHRDRAPPRLPSIFTPPHRNAGITPDRQDCSFHGDDHVRIALIVEQALLAEDWSAHDRGQLVVGKGYRRQRGK